MAHRPPLQCTEQDDEYPPNIEVAQNLDPHNAPAGGIQPNPKPKVYISYTDDSDESTRYVRHLQDILLQDLGYERDDVLTIQDSAIVGLSTSKSITQLLKQCKKMIVVVSKNYTTSHWKTFEMATMLKNGDINDADIIPIISDDGSTEEDMPDELCILIPLKAGDRNFVRRLQQSLEYRSNS